MEIIYFLMDYLIDPFSYLVAISLKALIDTSRILGTWFPVILNIEVKHFSTYFSPTLDKDIYFNEYIAEILKW